jgi:hypothetical protein
MTPLFLMVLQAVGSLAEARAAHSATLLPDGTVMIAGGFRKGPDGRSQLYYATTEIYDAARRTFRPGPTMRIPRCGHSATPLGDGTILFVGGNNDQDLASAEIYDPVRREFQEIAPMSGTRIGFSTTLLPDGRVLIAGGWRGKEATDTAEIFDPRTRRFAATGKMAGPRGGHTATLLRDGRVLLAGGGDTHGPQAASEIYDPRTGTFARGPSLVTPRYKHAAALLADGRVLVVGGSDARDWKGQLDSAEIFDPKTQSFSPAGKLAGTRFKLKESLVVLPDGRVLVTGGNRLIESFDPATGRFGEEGMIDAARHYGTATALRDGGVLIVGGYEDASRVMASAWLYAR